MEERKILADKYQIISEIKKGGFGTVYFGYDLHLNKPVAIKEMNPSLLHEAKYVDMFLAEARYAARLNHRNIVHIFDLKRVDNNQVYIIMEYIDGGDLRSAIIKCRQSNQRFPLNLAVFIIGEVCKALDFAYTRKDIETNEQMKLVHQDICPSNIMLSNQGVVKLIDFGIAGIRFKQMSEKKNSVIVAGKLPYMSPEQLDSDFQPSRNSDIFALGSVFYEILTGHRAFAQTQADELVEAIRRAKIDTVSLRAEHIPVEIQKVILRGMQKDPAQRYQSAGEMYQDIDDYLVRTFGKQDLSYELAGWMRDFLSQPEELSQNKQEERTNLLNTPSMDDDTFANIELDTLDESQLEEEVEQSRVLDNLMRHDKVSKNSIETEEQNLNEISNFKLESINLIPYKAELKNKKLDVVEIEEAEDDLKTIIDVVRLSARTHKKAIIGSLIGILVAFLLFSGLDTVFKWTRWGSGIYDYIFPPAIKIITVPPDAAIFLDDKDLQVTSPVSIPRISPGVHKLTLRLPGYPELVRSIKVPSKGTVTVVGEKSRSGREPYLFRFQSFIELNSNPQGATVFLNDVQYSEVTPCTVPWDVGVPFIVKMEKPGFELLTGFALDIFNEIEQIEDRRIWHFSKATDEFKHFSIEGTFRKHVLVNSVPIGAEIYVDNEPNPVGLTGYQSDVLLTVGKHELILRRDGYLPSRASINVSDDEITEINEILYRTVRFFAKDITDQTDNEIGATVKQLISRERITNRNDVTPCEIALGPYPYEVLVQKSGFKDAIIQIPPDARVAIARMEPEALQLNIEVVDALTGAPINRAQISYRDLQSANSEDKYFALTDDNGRCMRSVPSGRYAFKVKKFGYRESIKTFVSDGGSNNTLSFRLVLM